MFGSFAHKEVRSEPGWLYPDTFFSNLPHLVFSNTEDRRDWGLSILCHDLELYNNGPERMLLIETLQGVKGYKARFVHERIMDHIVWSARPLLEAGMHMYVQMSDRLEGGVQRDVMSKWCCMDEQTKYGRATIVPVNRDYVALERILELEHSPLLMKQQDRKKLHT